MKDDVCETGTVPVLPFDVEITEITEFLKQGSHSESSLSLC